MRGEPIIEYLIGLKRLLDQNIFVLRYSNYVMAYIPFSNILKEGGYKGESSQVAYGLPSRWNPDIKDKIFQEMIKLANLVGIVAKIRNQ